MNRFVCFAFAIVFVQISLTETGLIKDVISSFSGGGRKNNKPSENYSPDTNYKNTTWFIENEDYLTPNTNTSTQSGNHRPGENTDFSNRPNTDTTSGSSHSRPSGSHHNSGFSNRPSTGSSHYRPSTDTTSESTHHSSGFSNKPSTETLSESIHHRPNGSHHGSGFSNTKRPNTETLSGSSHHRPNTDTTSEFTHPSSGFSNRPSTEILSGSSHHRPNTDTSSESTHHRPSGSHQSSSFSNRPNTETSSGSSHYGPSGSHNNSGFSNRPTTDTTSESTHHSSGFSNKPSTETLSGSIHHRPNGSHHGSGFSNTKRPNTETLSVSSHHRPGTDTTSEPSHHNSVFSNKPTTETLSGSSHSRPTGSHNSGLSTRPPNYGNFPSSPSSSSSSSSNNSERPFSEYKNQRDEAGDLKTINKQDQTKREIVPNEDGFGQPVPLIPGETLVSEPLENTKTRADGQFEESDDGNNIILTSDNSIVCCYSNIKDENIENRHLRCNETDCVLEKVSEKSSLWICKNIKCNVANVDFTQNVENKRLIECAMDGRNIIKVQDRPIACGPDEREHNGRCRKVFGA